MGKRVSIKDIAREIGISTALVSYVLNGQEKEKRVGADMAEKIRSVAKELNYKPNQLARSLRNGSSKTIGLIIADIANPFFGSLARIIEDEANKFGYTVIFGSVDENSAKSAILIDTLLDRQVDGFIIVPAEGTEEQIQTLVKKEVPLVLVDRFFPNIQSSHVVLNNYDASHDAVSLFIQKGFNRIGIIAYKSELIHMKDRLKGFTDGLMQNGLGNNILVKEVGYSNVRNDVENAIAELVINEKKIDALFFATNSLTIAGMYSIKKNDIKVPDELAVIGFDGNESFDFFYSPITYIEQPIDEMGKESVKVLMNLVKNPHQITHISLKHRLVQRESSG